MLTETVNNRLDTIRNDRSRGASELALLALDSLAAHSQTCSCHTPLELMEKTLLLAGALADARPSMAPLFNALEMFREEIASLQPLAIDILQMREQLELCVERVQEKLKEIRQHSIAHAVSHIQSGQCIGSCSFSSTVIEALVQTSQAGKQIRTIWPESRFDGYSYGNYSQSRLDEFGIPCQLVEDYEIDKAMQSADLIILGADTLLPSGDLINGCPSKAVAKSTRRSRGPLPLYCLADSSKILWTSEIPDIEPGLEKVPHEWLEGIFTEKGLTLPRQLKLLQNPGFSRE